MEFTSAWWHGFFTGAGVLFVAFAVCWFCITSGAATDPRVGG